MSELDIKYNLTDFIVIKPKIIQDVCPACKGTGEVVDYYSTFQDRTETVATYKTCGLCRGTGKVNGELFGTSRA